MKRQLPIFIVFITGIIMVIQFFVPHAWSEFLFTYANDFVIVIGILALPLGIFSLMRGTVKKAQRDPKERIFALATIAGFLVMVVAGVSRDNFTSPTSLLQYSFNYILIPCQATLFSMLAFYVASAAYRAFRVRTWLATVLLVTAFILMLRIVPLPGPLSEWVAALVRWILEVPNMAAKRAIIIGVGLGGVAYSMKIILGIERGYMGRD
ncbi:MAG: hypothetical protein KJ970_17855 [Candidatus Eisenbacteria bacterium]|uniref:Uncharacterized protein n=1 Tax=Eiseniibacteriota bacterium TaxID=2212470 RepID=A0A948W8K3_UNCEI|nr:hypothetical protein [Candidatus Eisenbacteria bacterium]MBU1950825.1 hypothetical protein [Candidatus Eisenbacteria bacterium]MBU2692786.1 hypothetical protein [Candidatus Eisenbacteria bacterium]